MNTLREQLAALEHEQWAHWTRYLLDNLTPENAERWRRQCETPYDQLTEAEKASDRAWADKVLAIVGKCEAPAEPSYPPPSPLRGRVRVGGEAHRGAIALTPTLTLPPQGGGNKKEARQGPRPPNNPGNGRPCG